MKTTYQGYPFIFSKIHKLITGPTRWECSLGRHLTIVRHQSRLEGATKSTLKTSVRIEEGNCSPDSSRFYRLRVSQAQKSQGIGERRPQRRTS